MLFHRWTDGRMLFPHMVFIFTNQPTKDLTRPSFCIAIPTLIASLDTVTNTYNYNKDYACGNNFQSHLKILTWTC